MSDHAGLGRVYPDDFCQTQYAGYGECILEPDHDAKHRDAFGFEFQTPDDIITQITQAPTEAAALAIMQTLHSGSLLRAVADQLYIETDGHTPAWLRKAIVKEARA